MRNHRSRKIREYRKSIRGAKGYISLWKLFNRLFPDNNPYHYSDNGWSLWYQQRRNFRDEWFRKITTTCLDNLHGESNAPAHFRRELNRLHRNKEKQAMRDAAANCDWDLTLPRFRRNANSLWW